MIPSTVAEQYSRAAQLQQQTAAMRQQAAQQQAMAPIQQQMAEQQARQQQLDLQDAENAHKLGPQFLQKDANGKITGFDNEGYYNALIGTGMNPAKVQALRTQQLTYQQGLQKLGKDQLDLQNEKNNNAYETVEPLRQAATDPNADIDHINSVWAGVAPKLMQLGVNPNEMPTRFGSPQEAQQRLADFETELGQHKQMLADAKTTAETGEAQSKAEQGNWQKFPELGLLYNTQTKQTVPMSGATMTPQMMESKYVQLQADKAQGKDISAPDQAFMKGFERMKTLVPQFTIAMQNATGAGKPSDQVAQQFGMTPEAFDQTAEKYFQTGQLPPIGRGGQGQALNKALMNRAGELHPGASLAENTAEYKANSESLKKFQTQFDSVNAFENTAEKNIDRLLTTAKTIPDLGARFANIPLRMVTGQMIGTENMARFKSDLATAQNEAAKVLNSANMTGVLSDSARKELQDIADGNLSYPALAGAFDEIKRDMGNRKQSYQETISDIKGRMKTGKPSTDNTPPTSSPSTGAFNWDNMPKHQ